MSGFWKRFFGGGSSQPTASGTATLTNPDDWSRLFSLSLSTASGISVTGSQAMTVPGVAACVQVISEDLAKVPLALYRRSGSGKERATSHPLYRLVHERPSPWLTSFSMRRVLVQDALLEGVGYLRARRGLDGQVERLAVAPAREVGLSHAEDGEPFYTWQNERGLGYQDMVTVLYRAATGASKYGGLTGVSPIHQHREAVALALAAELYGAGFFRNGARPSFVLQTENKVDTETAKGIIQAIRSSWAGTENASKIAMLPHGVEAKQLQYSNDDSQFVELREYQAEEMARIFRVPPHKIGLMKRATFSNIEHQAIEYVTDTLSALAKNIESALSTALLTEAEQQEYFFEHNLEGLLRGDIASRYRAYSIGRQWGWLSVDEVRALENMNELPDGMGEVYLEPLNMRPRGEDVDEADEPPSRQERPAGAIDKPVLVYADGQPIRATDRAA